MGLLLAIAGLYGVVAYNVSRRTREIGIRMAIGAGPVDVLRLVMGKGLVLVGIGTVIGLAMGFAVEQLMNSMLFNAGGVDMIGLSHRRAVDGSGDHAGGLRARAKSIPDRADAGAAIRVVIQLDSPAATARNGGPRARSAIPRTSLGMVLNLYWRCGSGRGRLKA